MAYSDEGTTAPERMKVEKTAIKRRSTRGRSTAVRITLGTDSRRQTTLLDLVKPTRGRKLIEV